MKLFRLGNQLFKQFNLSLESELIFSDNCKTNIYPYKHRIKFTSKALLFLHPGRGEFLNDDWIDCEHIEFYPWGSIIGFENFKGAEITRSYEKKDIDKWLANIKDYEISFPFVHVRRGNVTYMNRGMPKSIRSAGWKKRITEDVQALRNDILQILPQPWKYKVQMQIDVFYDGTRDHPDLDRLAGPITDAFQGIAYEDDKQIKNLNPRMFDVSKAFDLLEFSSSPMSSFSLDNIPTGIIYPLSLGLTNYFAVRMILHY